MKKVIWCVMIFLAIGLFACNFIEAQYEDAKASVAGEAVKSGKIDAGDNKQGVSAMARDASNEMSDLKKEATTKVLAADEKEEKKK